MSKPETLKMVTAVNKGLFDHTCGEPIQNFIPQHTEAFIDKYNLIETAPGMANSNCLASMIRNEGDTL